MERKDIVMDKSKIFEIRRISRKNGLFLTDESCDQLVAYVKLLLDWNKRVNLVSRRDVDNVWEAHILHSLSILFECPLASGADVLDLGTGGGLPGVPLKITQPNISLKLMDATRKKVDAVRVMLKELDLRDAVTVWGRAEDETQRERFGGSFDVVITRAVASLENLVVWSRPYIKVGNNNARHQLIALKGGDIRSEVDRVARSGLVKNVEVKALTFDGAERIPGIEKKIVMIQF